MFRAFDRSTIPNRGCRAIAPIAAWTFALSSVAVSLNCGCATTPEFESPTVRQAVAQRSNDPPRKPNPESDRSQQPAYDRPTSWSEQLAADADGTSPVESSPKTVNGLPIATIKGQDIARSYIDRMMLREQGVDALEPLIVLEQAIQRCEQLGLIVTDVDIQREYDRRLMDILSPIESGASDPEFDRTEAERLLKGILERRRISKLQYLSAIKRNAYLRAIAYKQMQFTDAELQKEFEGVSGEQAVIRHIQLPSQSDAEKVRVMLLDGLDFREAAIRHSANLRTGPSGGLLKPFTLRTGEIPHPIRQAAFELAAGEVSDPIPAGSWWHLVKLEKKVANGETNWAGHRSELESRLREQRADSEMQGLYRSLLQGADVKINDPVLAEQYANRRAPRVE